MLQNSPPQKQILHTPDYQKFTAIARSFIWEPLKKQVEFQNTGPTNSTGEQTLREQTL